MIKLRPLKYVIQAFYVQDDGETLVETTLKPMTVAPKDLPLLAASLESMRADLETRLNRPAESKE